MAVVLGCSFPGMGVLADPTISWTGSSSTDWFTGTNWSTGDVPASSDFAEIDTTDPNATVISDSSTNGTAEVDLIIVGDSNTGSLIIENGGALTVDDTMSIAEAGGTGTVTVTGSGSTLMIADELNIGDQGTGTLTIADGGAVTISPNFGGFSMGGDSTSVTTLVIGAGPGETAVAPGTLTMAGAAIIDIAAASEASLVFNHTGDEDLQYTFSPGSQLFGASATISVLSGYTIFSGDNTGFGGEVVVDGGDMVVTNTLASSDVTVGETATESSLSIQNGAAVTVDGIVTIAEQSGSGATLAIGAASGTATTAGTLTATSITFGDGTGTLLFNHSADSADPADFSTPITGDGLIQTLSGYTELSSDTSGFSGNTYVNGGTLAITGDFNTAAIEIGDSDDVAEMVVDSAVEIDTSGDATIGVSAGDSGALTVSGGATLSVSGTLTAGNEGTGTLVLNDYSTIAVNGGSGTLAIASEAGSTGTFVIGAESEGSPLGSGTLSAASVTFGNGSGSLVFNHADTSGSFAFSPTITGSGDINIQAGITALSADNSGFTGTTTIDGGILNVSGTLAGNIDVNDGGTLAGTGTTTGAVSVASGGAISPGASVGTIQTGDVTFESGALFVVEIDSDGNADALQSSGTVTLDGGTVSISADSYDDGASFTIVSADTAVTGTFTDADQPTAFFDYTLSYGTTSVTLTQTLSQSFESAGATDNHQAVGSALDSLPTDHPVVQHTFGAATETEARSIFDSLSGEVHASMQGALMDNDRNVSAAINRRLGGGASADSGEVFAYGTGQTADPQTGAWIAGYGGWNDIDATGNTAAADNDYGGIVAGLDREFGQDWRLGVVGAYGHTDLSQSALASSSDADSFSAGVYGSATHGQHYINFGGLAGWHDIDSSRSVTIRRATQNLTASYDATSWQLFGETGYRIDRGDTTFQPFAGLSFLQLDTDGYSETGGSAALTAASSTETTTYTTLGLRLGRQVTGEVRVYGMAGWRHAFGDVDPTTTFTLAGSIPFTVTGAPIAEDALVVEAGFEVDVSDTLSLSAAYDGQFGDGSTANQVEGQLRLQF